MIRAELQIEADDEAALRRALAEAQLLIEEQADDGTETGAGYTLWHEVADE